MECSSMSGLCARLIGGLISLQYIYIQCSSIQCLCAQLTGGSFSLLSQYIYLCNVAECKSSVLN